MVGLITKQIMFLGYCSLERDFSQEFGFRKIHLQSGNSSYRELFEDNLDLSFLGKILEK